METVEAFCAAHNESVDTVLYDWPASKFEALNDAFHRRIIADALDHRRALEVSSLYANGNFENEEKFSQAIESIQESYGLAIAGLYEKQSERETIEDTEAEIDMNDPFFAAMNLEG